MGLISSIRNSIFVRHNAVFFIGSLSIGFLNYLFYPVVGHLLKPNSFGEVQTLSSLFTQIVIFLSVLGLLTVNIVANYHDVAHRNRMVAELEKLALLISSLLLIASIATAGVFKQFFHFGSSLPFPVMMVAVLTAVPFTFQSAYLRGRKYFGLASIGGVISSSADLVFAAGLVALGFGTTGAILGLALGQAGAIIYTRTLAVRHGFTESLHTAFTRPPDLKFLAPEMKYSLLVLIGSLGITGMYSIDTLVVKHYFDARAAGLYAGISTVARIIFFLTASVPQVLLPAVRLRDAPRDNQRTLLKSLLLMLGIGLPALAIFALVPKFVISLLMGGKYLTYANLLPRLSLAIFIISIINLFIMYHMALRHYMIILVVILGVGITVALLRTHHQTLQAVINNLLYGSLAMLAILGIGVGSTMRNVNKLQGRFQ